MKMMDCLERLPSRNLQDTSNQNVTLLTLQKKARPINGRAAEAEELSVSYW